MGLGSQRTHKHTIPQNTYTHLQVHEPTHPDLRRGKMMMVSKQRSHKNNQALKGDWISATGENRRGGLELGERKANLLTTR